MIDWFDAAVLTGGRVRLEPLRLDHVDGLFAAAGDPDIWRWTRNPMPRTPDDMRAVVDRQLAWYAARTAIPYAQIDARTGEVAGSTSFYDISEIDRHLHIGYTWIGANWRGTGFNTESKLLMLDHAFGALGAERVAWHADILNVRSLRAIEKLGAVREGVLRRHRVRQDGSFRDTVAYAMTREEWPAAREALAARLR